MRYIRAFKVTAHRLPSPPIVLQLIKITIKMKI